MRKQFNLYTRTYTRLRKGKIRNFSYIFCPKNFIHPTKKCHRFVFTVFGESSPRVVTGKLLVFVSIHWHIHIHGGLFSELPHICTYTLSQHNTISYRLSLFQQHGANISGSNFQYCSSFFKASLHIVSGMCISPGINIIVTINFKTKGNLSG